MNGNNHGVTWLESLYIGLGVIGLVGTWAQLPAYLPLGFVEGNIRFWQETLATHASTFIVVDILVLGAAVLTWMFGECRRLGIATGWAWTYFLVSVLIGISFAIPVFMAHRQRRLRLRHPEQQALPAASDFVAVGIVLLLAIVAVLYSLLHMPG